MSLDDRLFNLSLELIVVATLDGVFERVNHRWHSVLGHSDQALIGHSILDFVHPDDRASTLAAIASLRDGDHPPLYENRLRHHQGHYLWLRWVANIDEQQQRIYAVATNITIQKRQRSYLEKLSSLTKCGYWEIDPDTQEVFWSHRVHVIHETDARTFRPTVSDGINFYHPDSIPVLTAAVNTLSSDGTPFDLELKLVTAKGNLRWVQSVAHSEFRDNKVVRIYGTFRDITELIEQREETRMLRERIELAYRAANIGVWDFDVAKDVLVWDDNMYALYGYEADAFLGTYASWLQCLHPDDRYRVQCCFDNAIAGLASFDLRFRIMTPSGQCRHIAAVAKVSRNIEGHAVRILGVNWDVTKEERARTELLRQKLLAEKHDKAKSRFLANMSHELRTPLNSIIGFSGRLLKQLSDNDDERSRRAVESIFNNGKYLLKVINDILDLSKINSGHLGLQYQHCHLHKSLASVMEGFRDYAETKGLVYEVQLTPVPVIDVDELRIKQVLLNVINNSIKFTEEGRVCVALDMFQEHWIRIIVEDSGPGITVDEQKYIFSRFDLASEKEDYQIGQGAGLSLALSHEIIKMHGGKFNIESTVGVGTKIVILLPLIAAVCEWSP